MSTGCILRLLPCSAQCNYVSVKFSVWQSRNQLFCSRERSHQSAPHTMDSLIVVLDLCASCMHVCMHVPPKVWYHFHILYYKIVVILSATVAEVQNRVQLLQELQHTPMQQQLMVTSIASFQLQPGTQLQSKKFMPASMSFNSIKPIALSLASALWTYRKEAPNNSFLDASFTSSPRIA